MSARAQSGGSGKPMGKPAGVGIYFQESGSDIVVNHLIRGGSAERSGKVQAGDVIVAIDDKDVRGKGVSEMRNFIVGPEGSKVNLGFNRDGQSFTVSLLRGSPEYITSVMGPAVSTSKSPMLSSSTQPSPSPRVGPTNEPAAAPGLLIPPEKPDAAGSAGFLLPSDKPAVVPKTDGRVEALVQENKELQSMLEKAQREASQGMQAERSKSAEAMRQLQQERDRVQQELLQERENARRESQALQEARTKLERDVETHRLVAQNLQLEVRKLQSAPPMNQPPQGAAPEEVAAMRAEIERLGSQLAQSKEEQRVLAMRVQELSKSSAPPPDSAGMSGDVVRMRQMLEERNAECQRLEAELRAAKMETMSKVQLLQEAMQVGEAASGTPVQLDVEFRDTGRAAIIALPHVVTHLQHIIDNQDRIRSLVPVTTVMLHGLEATRQRCTACIPQAVPQLVSLLVSKQPTTVREASFALSLTSMSIEGRKAVLSMPQALAHLETLLSSGDVQTRRNGAMALGNLAMEAPGRSGMLEVFTVVQDLTQLLSTDDLDCRRSACLALGNLVIEEDAREQFLGIAMSVRALSEQLKSRDRFLVRYATGAMRNVAVDEKGRRAVLAQQDAVAALKGLLASPDQTTAKFAGSALRNLSLTPFSSNMGPSDPTGKPYQGSTRVQAPTHTTASFLGMPVPFADSDGRDIPLTMSESRAVNGAISL